jgi:kynurenine formamidase
MDAPFHFYEEGRTIDQVPIEQCMGPALVIDLGEASPAGTIEIGHLQMQLERLRRVQKVILNMGWSRRWGRPEYFTDHPVLSGDAARFLVDCGVDLVGIDAPSVDRPPFPAHLVLLGSGAIIVENLTNVDSIKSELFTLVVLPLALTAREASPVRAIAVEE